MTAPSPPTPFVVPAGYELRKIGAAPRIPPGWRLVPDAADKEMVRAAEEVEDLYRRGTPDTWRKVFREMIGAAPMYRGETE